MRRVHDPRRALPGSGIPATALSALLLLAPASAGAVTVFGLVDSGELYASGDGGVSWAIRSTLPVRDAAALAAGSSSTQLFLASASGSFYRSQDAGMSWAAVSTVTASDVTALVTAVDRFLLLTESGSVYGSADQGSSWSAVGAITAPDVVDAARSGSRHFALTRTGTVYRSDDLGASWGAVGTMSVSNAVGLAVLGGNLYALTATGEVARSVDLGANWSFVGTLSQSGMTALLATGSELIASTEGGEVATSAGGTSWSWRGAIGQLTVRALGSDIPTTTDVPVVEPRVFGFAAPWPNPAGEAVTLALELKREAVVTVEVFDAAGRRMAWPIAGERMAAGRTLRPWRPQELRPGRYVLRARIADQEHSRSLVWLGGR